MSFERHGSKDKTLATHSTKAKKHKDWSVVNGTNQKSDRKEELIPLFINVQTMKQISKKCPNDFKYIALLFYKAYSMAAHKNHYSASHL